MKLKTNPELRNLAKISLGLWSLRETLSDPTTTVQCNTTKVRV